MCVCVCHSEELLLIMKALKPEPLNALLQRFTWAALHTESVLSMNVAEKNVSEDKAFVA